MGKICDASGSLIALDDHQAHRRRLFDTNVRQSASGPPATTYARLPGMSGTTWRGKRKATAELPVETDWLWSCPPDMPLSEIGRRLGFTNEPRTELSARLWAGERRMRDDLYWALAPHMPLDRLAPHVGWDALDDDLSDARAHGRLIALRDFPAEPPHAAQMLIDIIGLRRRERGFHLFESRPGARFALVLAGWSGATIRVRSRRVTRYTVRVIAGEPA